MKVVILYKLIYPFLSLVKVVNIGIIGGLCMKGKKEDDVNVQDLTLRKSKGDGVSGGSGASMHLDNVSVENSEGAGVGVYGSKRNTMKNCNLSHSKYDGLYVGGGLMTIDGIIVSPLFKEMISTNNHRGQNYNSTFISYDPDFLRKRGNKNGNSDE